MSIDLCVFYSLIDNSLLPVSECEIDRVLWEYVGERTRMIHEADSSLRVWSKRCKSASLVSELLEMSESKVDLWFLTDDDDFSEGSLRVIPFECYDSYILEVQRLIQWSKNNMDKVRPLAYRWLGDDDGKDIDQEIDKALMTQRININDEFFSHYSLLLYLSAVVKMLREAMSKKMSIVVDMSWM